MRSNKAERTGVPSNRRPSLVRLYCYGVAIPMAASTKVPRVKLASKTKKKADEESQGGGDFGARTQGEREALMT